MRCFWAVTVGENSNRAQWCNEEFEALVQKAKIVSDPAERTKLYEEAQVVFKREAPWATIAHSVVFMPMRPKVSGYGSSAGWPYLLRRRHRRVRPNKGRGCHGPAFPSRGSVFHDRPSIAAHRAIARDLGVDAVALVPGPNFTRLYDAVVHEFKRTPVHVWSFRPNGTPAALVPNLGTDLALGSLSDLKARFSTGATRPVIRTRLPAMAGHLPIGSLRSKVR